MSTEIELIVDFSGCHIKIEVSLCTLSHSPDKVGLDFDLIKFTVVFYIGLIFQFFTHLQLLQGLTYPLKLMEELDSAFLSCMFFIWSLLTIHNHSLLAGFVPNFTFGHNFHPNRKMDYAFSIIVISIVSRKCDLWTLGLTFV